VINPAPTVLRYPRTAMQMIVLLKNSRRATRFFTMLQAE
jgi:hypothetical protein